MPGGGRRAGKGGEEGASGWLEKRGTAADLVLLLCSPCARNINASHFSSRPPSDESVSLSLSLSLPSPSRALLSLFSQRRRDGADSSRA